MTLIAGDAAAKVRIRSGFFRSPCLPEKKEMNFYDDVTCQPDADSQAQNAKAFQNEQPERGAAVIRAAHRMSLIPVQVLSFISPRSRNNF